VVVIAIMAVLVAGYFTFYGGRVDQARVSKTKALIQKTVNIVANYYADTGYYPSSAKQLWNNANGAPNWYGPYAEAPNGDPNIDYFPHMPWGGTATLECSDGNYVRFSMSRISGDLCRQIDSQIDDGDQASGRVRWENNDCNFYIKTGSSVKCK